MNATLRYTRRPRRSPPPTPPLATAESWIRANPWAESWVEAELDSLTAAWPEESRGDRHRLRAIACLLAYRRLTTPTLSGTQQEATA